MTRHGINLIRPYFSLLKTICLVIALVSLPVLAETNGDQTDHLAYSLLQVVGALVLIVSLILVMAWLAQRLKLAGAGTAQIKALSVLPLGRKEKVVLLESGGTKLLIGVTPSNVNVLHVIENANDRKSSDGDAVQIVNADVDEANPIAAGECFEKAYRSESNTPVKSEIANNTFPVSNDFSLFLKTLMTGKKE